jgi:hypothetical protein
MIYLKISLILALACFTLTACDTVYHSQQMAQRIACEKLPNPQEMRACLQNTPGSYDQYQKQREALKAGTAEPSPDSR